MSGFEIAGVVLGSFPLLISTCEHYKKGFEPLLKWKRFRTDFIGFIDAVDTERLLFDQVLERFLIGTDAVDYEELLHFMADPEYEGWKRKDLAEALERRLGPSMVIYMSTVKTMNNLVQQLQDLLLLKNGEVHWAEEGAKRWDYQMKRVQISFSKKGNNILTSLESHNRKLRELLDSNEKLESMKASQKDTTWANVFDCIRKHANSIHSAIKTGFCCSCSDHAASLRLEQRRTGDWTSHFNLAFSVLDPSNTDSKFRREVIVKARQNQDPSVTESKFLQSKTNNIESMSKLRKNFESKSSPELDQGIKPHPILSSSLSGSSGQSSRIKIMERISKSISRSSSSNGTECMMEELQEASSVKSGKSKKQVRVTECSLPAPIVQAPTAITVETKKIDNLCSAISCLDPTSGCLGYLTDGKQEHELHQVLPDIPAEDTFVSLEELLLGGTNIRLSRQQRYKLASVLASSLLQLQTTPWLSDKLNKKNIFFYRHGNKVVVDHPYIKHSFHSLKEDIPVSSQVVDRLAVRNSLSNLGILLLELCFGQAIETQDLRKPYLGPDGKAGEYTDYMTARDWAEFIDQEEPAFEQIIKCCVFCIFEEKADWENKKFTQAVYTSVVAPLDKIIAKWPTM